jgi:AraC-like DNA-binding protein
MHNMSQHLKISSSSDTAVEKIDGFTFDLIELTPGAVALPTDESYQIIFNCGSDSRHSEERNGKVMISPGNIIFILAPHSRKDLTLHAGGSFLRMRIEREFLAGWFGGDNIDFQTDTTLSSVILAQLMTMLFTEASKPQIIERRYTLSVAMAVVNELYCQFRASGKKSFSPKGKLAPQQMKKVIDFVKSSLHAEIHLATMANEVHLSEFHFSRLFRNTFGISPYQYVLQCKVEYAKTLLRHYPRSLSQIAHSLNFTDQSHFTNVFKKLTGICPSDFAMNRVKSVA